MRGSAFPMSASPSSLNTRAQLLFRLLMDHYLEDGKPVGSRTLSKEQALGGISPATIRNVLADLEDMGLLRSPHTSAGRVPTAEGFRLFIDSMLTVSPLEDGIKGRLQAGLSAGLAPSDAVARAGQMLSGFSRMASVIFLPRREAATLTHIDFLRLSERRVLVVLVFANQEVHNRIIELSQAVEASLLQQMANLLNHYLPASDLKTVRAGLLAEMHSIKSDLEDMMLRTLTLAQGALDAAQQGGDDLIVSGKTNLMQYEELADTSKLRALFDAFAQQQQLLGLLDQTMAAEGVQIFIGQQSGHQVLSECTLVAAPYQQQGQTLGVLGVIGPARMPYDRVIPMVDVTARLLTEALKSG